MSSEAAATSLILLSTPPRSTVVAMPLKKRFKADDDGLSQETCVLEDKEGEDDKACNVEDGNADVFSTPVKQFRLCGVKREKEGLLRISYKSNDEEYIDVPMHIKDTKTSFVARRDQLLKQMFDDNRSEVYCAWRDTLLSMLVKDARWTLYRESLQQKRYLFKTIQLVVSRFTCTQWRDRDLCRNCSNRNWRTGSRP